MRFWDLALQEHALYNKTGRFDDSLSSFFRNVDTRHSNPVELPVGEMIQNLKARAVVVDMEQGVINEMMRSEIGEIFDARHFISDVSGAGNNWSVGYFEYGEQYKESIMETVRRTVEPCESLQSFFLMHSMGGGTGSGLGTRILSLLEDDYPEVFRFSTVVFPEDDVVTGPYNSILALNELSEHADCVLPIDNSALYEILGRIEKFKAKGGTKGNIVDSQSNKKSFDQMNNIIAHMLNNLT